jgi:hypothetical protein
MTNQNQRDCALSFKERWQGLEYTGMLDYIFITLDYISLPDELEHTINYFLLNKMKKLAYGHNTLTVSEPVLEF